MVKMKTQNKYTTQMRRIVRVTKEIMPPLPYHNWEHARKIYSIVSLLGRLHGLNPEEMRDLQTSGLIHD